MNKELKDSLLKRNISAVECTSNILYGLILSLIDSKFKAGEMFTDTSLAKEIGLHEDDLEYIYQGNYEYNLRELAFILANLGKRLTITIEDGE